MTNEQAVHQMVKQHKIKDLPKIGYECVLTLENLVGTPGISTIIFHLATNLTLIFFNTMLNLIKLVNQA